MRAKIPGAARPKQTENAKAFRKAQEQARRETFFAMLKRAKLPMPAVEIRFHDERQWRFDYAWADAKVALEVEGGAHTDGRHTRGKGFEEDMHKYNAATLLGWRVFRTTPEHLCGLTTETLLRRALAVTPL